MCEFIFPPETLDALTRLEDCGIEAWITGEALLRAVNGSPGESGGVFEDTVTPGGELGAFFEGALLTCLAMAWNPGQGLKDPAGGMPDIYAGVSRLNGDPLSRFRSDPLAALKCVRIASVHGLFISPDVLCPPAPACPPPQGLQADEARELLTGILCGEYAGDALTRHKSAVFAALPELAPCDGFEQNNPNHIHDVYTHTVKTVAALPRSPVLRWAGLLHDIGKPASHFTDETMRSHFRGHEALSALIAGRIMRRLRFPARERMGILTLIRLHDTPVAPEAGAVLETARLIGHDALSSLIDLKLADNGAKSAAGIPVIAECLTVRRLLQEILASGVPVARTALQAGAWDAARAGFQGKSASAALARTRAAVMKGEAANERGALTCLLSRMAQEAGAGPP